MVFETDVSLMLFLISKMVFAELLRAAGIVELCVAKLLAGQVEFAVTDSVETVETAVLQRNAVYLAAVDILHQKRRDRALSQRAIVRALVSAHPRRAGLGTPEPGQEVVVILGC